MGDVTNILCGRCKVALEGPADFKPQDRFACPKCGTGDTYDNVMREVGKHVEEQAAIYLQKSFRDAVRGNTFLKFESKHIPKRSYRFIAQLDLR